MPDETATPGLVEYLDSLVPEHEGASGGQGLAEYLDSIVPDEEPAVAVGDSGLSGFAAGNVAAGSPLFNPDDIPGMFGMVGNEADFSALPIQAQDSLIESLAGKLVDDQHYDSGLILYPDKLRKSAEERGISFRMPEIKQLPPMPGLSQFPTTDPRESYAPSWAIPTTDSMTEKEFIEAVGIDPSSRPAVLLRERLRQRSEEKNQLSPSVGVGRGLAGEVATLWGLLEPWHGNELWSTRFYKQAAQAPMALLSMAAGGLAAWQEDLYNNINNLTNPIPGELSDIESRLNMSVADSLAASGFMDRVGSGFTGDADSWQIISEHIKREGNTAPLTGDLEGLFYTAGRISQRTGLLLGDVLELIYDAKRAASTTGPDGQPAYSFGEVVRDSISQQMKNSFELGGNKGLNMVARAMAMLGTPGATTSTILGLEGGFDMPRLDADGRAVGGIEIGLDAPPDGFSDTERRIAQDVSGMEGLTGDLPPVIPERGKTARDEWLPPEKREIQKRILEYNSDKISSLASRGAFGELGLRNPSIVDGMAFTAMMEQPGYEAVRELQVVDYALEQAEFMATEMPKNAFAAFIAPMKMLPDSVAESAVVFMTGGFLSSEEAREVIDYGWDRWFTDPGFSAFDGLIFSKLGGKALQKGVKLYEWGNMTSAQRASWKQTLMEQRAELRKEVYEQQMSKALSDFEAKHGRVPRRTDLDDIASKIGSDLDRPPMVEVAKQPEGPVHGPQAPWEVTQDFYFMGQHLALPAAPAGASIGRATSAIEGALGKVGRVYGAGKDYLTRNVHLALPGSGKVVEYRDLYSRIGADERARLQDAANQGYEIINPHTGNPITWKEGARISSEGTTVDGVRMLSDAEALANGNYILRPQFGGPASARSTVKNHIADNVLPAIEQAFSDVADAVDARKLSVESNNFLHDARQSAVDLIGPLLGDRKGGSVSIPVVLSGDSLFEMSVTVKPGKTKGSSKVTFKAPGLSERTITVRKRRKRAAAAEDVMEAYLSEVANVLDKWQPPGEAGLRPLGRGPNRYAQISNDLKFAIEYSNKMAGPLSELNRSVDILHGAGQAEGARGVRPGDRVYTAKLSQRAANKEIGRKKGDEEGYDKLNDAIDELNQTADSITNTVISVRTPLMFVKAGRGRIPEGVSRAMFDMAQAKADMMSAYGEAAAKGRAPWGVLPEKGTDTSVVGIGSKKEVDVITETFPGLVSEGGKIVSAHLRGKEAKAERAARQARVLDEETKGPKKSADEYEAELNAIEAQIARESGYISPDGTPDLGRYRGNLTVAQRMVSLSSRGDGYYRLFEHMDKTVKRGEGEPPLSARDLEFVSVAASRERAKYLAAQNRANSPSDVWTQRKERVAESSYHKYQESIAELALKEGMTPNEWLNLNSVERIAETLVNSGIVDPAVYQHIQKGTQRLSPKQAQQYANDAMSRPGRVITVPKEEFNAANALRTGGNAVGKYKKSNTETVRDPLTQVSARAVADQEVASPRPAKVKSDYQFGYRDRPNWYRIISGFLDETGLDVLSGRRKVHMYGRELSTGSRSVYAISEFMQRPYAFFKLPVSIADWVGQWAAAGGIGRSASLGKWIDQFLWNSASIGRKVGFPMANELLKATRTSSLYADQVKGIIAPLTGDQVKIRPDEMERVMGKIEATGAIQHYKNDFVSTGGLIVDAATGLRWVDATKRMEDLTIEGPNGSAYKLNDFVEKRLLFEGEWVPLKHMEDLVASGSVSPRRARLGVRDFSYHPKGGVAWGDLTSQQRAILLMANQFSRRLDMTFFDMGMQIVMGHDAIRLKTKDGEAFAAQLLGTTKGNLISKVSNWMTDYFDQRAVLNMAVDIYQSLGKTASVDSIDGARGSLVIIDRNLGMVTPGGGTNSRSTMRDKDFSKFFTDEWLLERTKKYEIDWDEVKGEGKAERRERLIKSQPDLGLSEIYELWNDKGDAGVNFQLKYKSGAIPGIIERYYRSKIWDPKLTYEQKIKYGLWDIRESAVKAATDLGTQLAKQKLTSWLRENGMILTKSERADMLVEAEAAASQLPGKARERALATARRRHAMFKEPGSRMERAGETVHWPDLADEGFVIHEYADKYVTQQEMLYNAHNKGIHQWNRALKLGLVSETGTILRNYMSNALMLGQMSDIPWSMRHNGEAARMIRDARKGVFSEEYMAARREGYGGTSSYHRSEFFPEEAFAEYQVNMLEKMSSVSGALSKKTKSQSDIDKIVSVIVETGNQGKKYGGRTPEQIFFSKVKLTKQRSPTSDAVIAGAEKRISTGSRVMRGLKVGKDWVAEKYGMVDDGAKLSYILELTREHGMTMKQAVKKANKTFMAYDDIAPFIDMLRNNAAGSLLSGPFVVFQIKALERSLNFMADSPWRAVGWAQLMQAHMSAVSAALGYDVDDLSRLMLETGHVPLPAMGHQRSGISGYGSGERIHGGPLMPTHERLRDVDAGVLSADMSIMNLMVPSGAYRGGKAPPGDAIGAALSAWETITGGGSISYQLVKNWTDWSKRGETFLDPVNKYGKAQNSVTESLFYTFLPIVPREIQTSLKLLAAKENELGLFHPQGFLEAWSGKAGLKMKYDSPHKLALDLYRNVSTVLRSIQKERGEIMRHASDVDGKVSPEMRDRSEDLVSVIPVIKTLLKKIKQEKDLTILASYPLWMPALIATSSLEGHEIHVDKVKEKLAGLKPGTQKWSDAINNFNIDEYVAYQKMEIRQAAAISASIEPRINLGMIPAPELFPE